MLDRGLMMNQLEALFIGNSYTYFNRMPFMVSKLAESSGKSLSVESVTQGGVSFEWHFNNPETLAAIEKTAWDIVVLQNRSLGPIENSEKMFEYGAALSDEAQKRGAEVVLYMTWARQHIPEMQETITKIYLSLAEKISARVAPVGLAWKKALSEDPDLVLHTEDKSHPNPEGSYLAACVFYSMFYNASPEGLTGTIAVDDKQIVDLSDHRAGFLQSAAWRTVQELASGD